MANTDGRTCDPGCILKHVLETLGSSSVKFITCNECYYFKFYKWFRMPMHRSLDLSEDSTFFSILFYHSFKIMP